MAHDHLLSSNDPEVSLQMMECIDRDFSNDDFDGLMTKMMIIVFYIKK